MRLLVGVIMSAGVASGAKYCGEENVTLSNGLVMPRVGYGCAGRASARSVETALRSGARLLDTAQAKEWYNEAGVADGLSASGVAREDVVIVTKMRFQCGLGMIPVLTVSTMV